MNEVEMRQEAERMAALPLKGADTPLLNSKPTPDTDKSKGAKSAAKAIKSGILRFLGVPTFTLAGGSLKDRQQGWGKDKVPHVDGGLAGTYAYINFAPFGEGCGSLGLTGSIWMEQFDTVKGVKLPKARRTFSISLPFVKAERKDGEGAEAIKAAKAAIEVLAREWRQSLKSNPAAIAAATHEDKWSEEVE